MSISPKAPAKHFTPFRSAAEEAAMKGGEDVDGCDNEGGQQGSTAGPIVRVPGATPPYTLVIHHQGRADTKRAFTTMREAEAFIRRNTPTPSPPSTLYDRPADADRSRDEPREKSR
jgi:hypothetical protein